MMPRKQLATEASKNMSSSNRNTMETLSVEDTRSDISEEVMSDGDGNDDDSKEEQYEVKMIHDYKYDCDDPKYIEKRKNDYVLNNNFLIDPSLKLLVEWENYPNQKDWTWEPMDHLYHAYESRMKVMQYMKRRFYEGEEEDADDKKTEDEHHTDWVNFAKKYSHKISFISSVNDIYPLAVQFTNEHNDEVRVRVKSNILNLF
ncbi:hypothetical protein PRIPAC_85711 [Pristionchus pacificus]|uniref:Chromo domain-containing protein n=1 Tax=Pristionchus pacificus TaxID=54126 RepID=A0A2A6C552_PRIPA|nr:hypothetical protein PRIPAC_85711 [Pristionchus pacificus]|eukprot:PDM73173.1 hypothetical protein PRIPAC_43269 [Pristionchus pacificus]